MASLMYLWCRASWTVFCIYYSFGTAAIIKAPHSQVVLPGQGVTAFQCMVNEFGIWFVNGTGLDDTNAATFQNRGITYSVTEVQSEDGNAVTNLTLLVEKRPGNNATLIQCYAYGSDVATSPYASLTIAGPPLPPSPGFQIVNTTRVVIAWDEPFTWTSVADILYYTVRMFNSSSRESMNWTDVSVATTNAYAHYFTAENVADQCSELTFEVSATNVVGRSKYGSVKGGFPIAMKWPEHINGTSRFNAILQYKTDGSVLVNCTVQVPFMCSFQQASYSIVISSYRSGTVVAKAITTRAYLKGDPITIPLMFKPQMAEDTEYNVILVVSSFGTDLQALTSFNISPTLMPKNTDGGALIVGASGAFAIMLIITVVVICSTVRGLKKARMNRNKDPNPDHYYEQAPPLPPVVEHFYEYIQDYQKKNTVTLVMDAKLDFLDSNWQSIHLVNSDMTNDSVVTTAPLQPPLMVQSSSSCRNTRVENQVGDYVEMRMIIESQDGKHEGSLASCKDFPVNGGNSSISCGPLAAL